MSERKSKSPKKDEPKKSKTQNGINIIKKQKANIIETGDNQNL